MRTGITLIIHPFLILPFILNSHGFQIPANKPKIKTSLNSAKDSITNRRSHIKNIAFAVSSLYPLSSNAAKTLSEEYRQGTAAKADSEEDAPIPKASYIKTPSGLTYADIRQGSGEVADEGKRVNIQWILRRSDGYFVDSSEVSDSVPFIFEVGDKKGVIEGVDE